MFPLLPFAVGLLTGAATIRLIKNEKAKKQLAKTQDRLREVTVSSLNAIEHSSARLRSRLESDASEVVPVASSAKVAAKPSRKRTAPPKIALRVAATPKARKAAQPKTGSNS